MRFRSLKNWDDPAGSTSLLFFAQILEEMLFDYSMDTYKASIMHSGLLCIEALQTIDEVDSGNIAEPNIGHVIDELCTNLEKDTVAQSLIKLPLDSFLGTLKNRKTSTKDLKGLVELISFSLSASAYRSKNEELIANAIRSNAGPGDLRRLARSYITTLTATGFSTKYIAEETRNFFYFGKNRISNNNAIDDFLSIFPSKKIEYSATFRIDKVFEHASDSFKPLGIEISRSAPEEIEKGPHISFSSKGEQVLYATIQKINARDVYSARSNAEELLKFCGTLVNLFHHKGNACWQPECVVRNKETGVQRLIKNHLNPMHKCADLIETAAKKKLQLFMSDFSLDKGSFSKFVRSAQLHSMALTSNSNENQILNLWISLESLIPSETKSDKIAGIEHIANSAIPFLNEQYISKLLNNLVKDLLRWNKNATIASLRPIPGKKFVDKLAKLISLQKYATERGILESKFRDFHLLRDRFDYFKDLLSSPKNVVTALDAHRQRLEWQIRRIYRARNIIVHSGKVPPYTQPLIEHTHDYLDTILSRLVELASKPRSIHSVAQGFKFIEIRYNTYHKKLSAKGLTFDENNIHDLLFYH